MIDVVIVYHEAEIAFLLGLVFAVHHLCQLLLGYPDFVGIPQVCWMPFSIATLVSNSGSVVS